MSLNAFAPFASPITQIFHLNFLMMLSFSPVLCVSLTTIYKLCKKRALLNASDEIKAQIRLASLTHSLISQDDNISMKKMFLL